MQYHYFSQVHINLYNIMNRTSGVVRYTLVQNKDDNNTVWVYTNNLYVVSETAWFFYFIHSCVSRILLFLHLAFHKYLIPVSPWYKDFASSLLISVLKFLKSFILVIVTSLVPCNIISLVLLEFLYSIVYPFFKVWDYCEYSPTWCWHVQS